MKKYLSIALVLCVFALLGLSCVSEEGAQSYIEKLIPDQTVVWVQAGNFNELLNQLDVFLEEAKMQHLMQGKSFRDLINDSAKMDLAEVINLEKPIGIGFMAIEEELNENFFIIAEIIDRERFENSMARNQKAYWKYTEDIIQLSSVPLEDLKFGGKFKLDPLKNYQASALSFIVDFQKLVNTKEVDVEALMKSFDNMSKMMAMEASEEMESFEILFQEIKDYVRAFFDETKWIAGSYGLNDLGLYLKSHAEFSSSGKLSKLMKDLKALGQIKPLIKYLPQKSFISMASSINMKGGLDFLETLLRASYGSLKVNPSLLDEYVHNLREMYEVLGTQMAMGLKLDVDFQKIILLTQSMGNTPPIGLIGEAFDVQGYMVNDLKDYNKYMELLARNMEMSNQLISKSFAPLGLNMELVMERNKEYQGFVYDEMAYNVSSKMGQNEMTELFNVIFGKFRVFTHLKDNKMYAYIGEENIPRLMDYVNNPGLGPDSFEQSDFYQRFKEHYPEESDVFFQLSLANLFGNLFEGDKMESAQGSPGTICGTTFDKSHFEGYCLFSKEEIASLGYLFNFFKDFVGPSLENAFGNI